MRALQLTDKQFGRWLVVARGDNSLQGKTQWLCQCVCGEFSLVLGTSLTRGFSQSCGCLSIEKTSKRNATHGATKSNKDKSIYNIWCTMKARCSNPNSHKYKSYGGRGIRVCDRWRDSFENFLNDMGERPGKGYSIDRIDNDGNYEPGNCHWATAKEQRLNQRKVGV